MGGARSLANEGAQLGSTVAVGACKVLGDVAAALLLDSWGRRPLMLGSSGGVAVCVALLGLVLVCGWGWGWLLFVLCAFMALFSLGLGAVTFLVANEVSSREGGQAGGMQLTCQTGPSVCWTGTGFLAGCLSAVSH